MLRVVVDTNKVIAALLREGPGSAGFSVVDTTGKGVLESFKQVLEIVRLVVAL